MSDYCYCDACTGMLEPPEPCQECWIASGKYTICDGSCSGLTEKDYRRHFGEYRWPNNILIHNGRKPRR